MPNLTLDSLQSTIVDDVRRALAEDVGDGDITASLIPAERQADGRIITREPAVFCDGTAVTISPSQRRHSAVTAVTEHWSLKDGSGNRKVEAFFFSSN